MKNIIYQYWDGEMRPGVEASVENISNYSKRIGAEHVFEHNPRTFAATLGQQSVYYGAFKPIYDTSYDSYDNVLFLDCDIFAVEDLEESIFDGFNSDIGICTEPFQPKQRTITKGQITSKRDELWSTCLKRKWNVDLPRTQDNLLQVYNSGVVLYSRNGLDKAKERFVPFREYINHIQSSGLINFYALDQNYLHAMMFICDMDVKELDNTWNSYVHKTHDVINPVKRVVDCREDNTKFVHIQMAGADRLPKEALWRITNLPQSEWNI